jgi:signal transduction histidine kinase
MKRKLSALSQHYATALKRHLKRGPHTARAGLRSALRLGREAVSLGLETLELARIHDRALALLKFSGSNPCLNRLAKIFFTEALTPILETHHARGDKTCSNPLNETLSHRTETLAATNRSLRLGISRHKTLEAALRKNDENSRKLLEESHHLQKNLQHLTHELLNAQEDKRRKLSSSLQDEIAQTLLGINVRLLTLKRETAFNTKGFKKGIACTQQLVKQSIQSINQFARDLDIHA